MSTAPLQAAAQARVCACTRRGRPSRTTKAVNADSRGRELFQAVFESRTGAQVAALLGISLGTLSYWRTGRCRPKYDGRISIERLFGVPAGSWSEPPCESGASRETVRETVRAELRRKARAPFVTVVAPLPELVFLDSQRAP